MPDAAAKLNILVVDDEPTFLEYYLIVLTEAGFSCVGASSAEKALELAALQHFDIALCDLRLGTMSGNSLLVELRRRQPEIEVTMMSGYGSIESAVEAMRLGAFDFLVKPFRREKMLSAVAAMAQRLADRRLGTSPTTTDLEELERLTVQRVLEIVNGDKEQAQKLLGISRATLYRKIKRYGFASLAARQAAARAAENSSQSPVYVSQQ